MSADFTMRLMYGGPPVGKREPSVFIEEIKARVSVQRFFNASREEMLKLSLADCLELAKMIQSMSP